MTPTPTPTPINTFRHDDVLSDGTKTTSMSMSSATASMRLTRFLEDDGTEWSSGYLHATPPADAEVRPVSFGTDEDRPMVSVLWRDEDGARTLIMPRSLAEVIARFVEVDR